MGILSNRLLGGAHKSIGGISGAWKNERDNQCMIITATMAELSRLYKC